MRTFLRTSLVYCFAPRSNFLRSLACLLSACTLACSGEDEYCPTPPHWQIAVTDEPTLMTVETGQPVAQLEVLQTDECKRSLTLDDFYVNFDVPDYSIGKTTRAIHAENLLVMELVDSNDDDRLGVGEMLILREGPSGIVPPGIEWTVWLMLRQGNGGAGMASATAVVE
jgi:hypothetical protein